MQANFDIPAANRNPMVDGIIERNRRRSAAPAGSANPDSATLASFNGYYLLQGAAATGAFLTIDTNIHVTRDITSGAFVPTFDVAVILCLDGQSPLTFDFSDSDTASFTPNASGGYVLSFATSADPAPTLRVDLTFTRIGMTDGQTATVRGTVTVDDQTATSVSGFTYNNPILPSLYHGDFYTHPASAAETAANVLSIGKEFELLYTPLSASGAPAQVDSYSYNMNMYFFSFTDSTGNETKLIMGTSAAGGLVCNDMTIVNGVADPRTLTTIKLSDQVQPDKTGVQLNQTNAEALAALSGYFPLTEAGSGATTGAFLSLEGQYVSSYLPLDTPVVESRHKVCIGISLDGVHSTVRYFDETCSFDTATNTLTVPGATLDGVTGDWVITFTPGYSAGSGSYSQFGDLGAVEMVFTPSGSNPIPTTYAGKTPLGPVPLSAFAGPTLSSTSAGSNEALQILSDHAILYTPPALSQSWQQDDQQQVWLDILYVPLMYIVAYQVRPADILDPDAGLVTGMLSLGTNGAHGLASINTRYLHLWPSLPPVPCPPTSVLAIPQL